LGSSAILFFRWIAALPGAGSDKSTLRAAAANRPDGQEKGQEAGQAVEVLAPGE